MKSFTEFDRHLSNSIKFGDKPVDDKMEQSHAYEGYFQRITQRNKFYPNTYGISSIPLNETISLITNYSRFDSLQLRSKIGNIYGKERKRKKIILNNVIHLQFLMNFVLFIHNPYTYFTKKRYILKVLKYNYEPVQIYQSTYLYNTGDKYISDFIKRSSLEGLNNILELLNIINRRFLLTNHTETAENIMCIGWFLNNNIIAMYFTRYFKSFRLYSKEKSKQRRGFYSYMTIYSENKSGYQINENIFLETKPNKTDYIFLIKILPNDFKDNCNQTIHILFGGSDDGTIKATEYLKTSTS